MIKLRHYISEILLTGFLINQAGTGYTQNLPAVVKFPEQKKEKSSDSKRKPNFIVILTDDQGYQDVGIYGSLDIKTPRLDRMAEEGIRFTNFYAQTVCGPSRASLMTGCYPMRIGTKHNTVEPHPRLHAEEITIAEVLKDVGYVNGVFGKWDLAGHSQTEYEKDLLPGMQGFDYFFGTPTSNDAFVNLLKNDQKIELNADLGTLTKRYTDEVIKFIDDHKEKPFFVYLAHTMPHMKLAASDQFQGKSKRGLYGDVI
jgi:arylsulfatase A-like enzyme